MTDDGLEVSAGDRELSDNYRDPGQCWTGQEIDYHNRLVPGTSSDKFLLVNLSQLELGRAPLLRTNQEKELIKKNLCAK